MSFIERPTISALIKEVYQTPIEQIINRLNTPNHQINTRRRKNSWAVSDAAFGDAGKGSIADLINDTFSTKRHPIVSVRYNGGGNAGHDITKTDGRQVTTHHLPVAISTEGGTAMIARTCAIQTIDIVNEYNFLREEYGNQLPGQLKIDPLTLLGTPLHKAMESTIKTWHQSKSGKSNGNGGQGSTGNGISVIYADKLLRQHLTLRDLLDRDWQTKFADQYRLYAGQIDGIRRNKPQLEIPHLSEISVWEFNGHGRDRRPVGTLDQYLEQLAATKNTLKSLADKDWREFLRNSWHDTRTPITFEGAQGPGLAPWVGVDPDITASQSTATTILDATYGIASAQDVHQHYGVLKTYISSVGSRQLSALHNANVEDLFSWIQDTFSEKGKTTGRTRDIYPLEFGMLNYFRRADGYRQIALTHLDAENHEMPMHVINHLTDQHQNPAEYYPDQKLLNQTTAHVECLPSWDGSKVSQAKEIDDLPENAIRFIYLIEQALGTPVDIVKTGPKFEDAFFNHL